MKHLGEIAALVRTLMASNKFHSLVIQGPAGFGKSTTIERVLADLNISYKLIGNYSTALYLYNSICANANSLLVMDDSVGLFGDAISMSVLKAATWPSSGTNGQRIVSWGSAGTREVQPSVIFTGKVILLTNNIPAGQQAEAFLSRSLFLSIQLSPEEISDVLTEAASSTQHYPDQSLARKVASFLSKRIHATQNHNINLRTLQMGYELAETNPNDWKSLLDRLLPGDSPKELVLQLSRGEAKVADQLKQFVRKTGLSRRTFFLYRKQLGIHQSESESSANCTDLPEALHG